MLPREQRDPNPRTSAVYVFGVSGTSGETPRRGFVTWRYLGPETGQSRQRQRAGADRGWGESRTGTGVNGEGWAVRSADSSDSRAGRHSSNKLNGEYLKMTLVYCPDQVSGKNIGRLNKETGCFSR